MSTTSLAQLFQGLRYLIDGRRQPVDIRDMAHQLRELFERLAATLHGGAGATGPDAVSVQRTTLNDALRGAAYGTLLAVGTAPATQPRRQPPPQPSFAKRTWDRILGDSEYPPNPSRTPEPAWVGPVTTVDPVLLAGQLQGAFEAADRVLALAEPPPPKVVKTPWSADSELLDLFQDLLEAQLRGDGVLALHHVERLRRSLPLAHGVDVVDFDGTNQEMFEVGTNPDPAADAPATFRPALVVDGRVFSKGGAWLPRASSAPAPSAAPLPPSAAPPSPSLSPSPSSPGRPVASTATPAEPEAPVSQPEVSQPEVSQPEVSQPEVSQPEVSQPEVSQPEVSQPEVSQPEVSQPEAPQPQEPQPDVAQPATPADGEADTRSATLPGPVGPIDEERGRNV